MQLRLSVALTIGLAGCLGPNPLIGAGELGSESATSGTTGDGDPGDGDGDPGDGDGDPGDGDGDGETGDGDGDPTPVHCDNLVQDADETDVDCGGSCDPCEPGEACLVAGDCDSSVCEANQCAAAACDDDVRNGDELEVDCGGSCRFCSHSDYIDELDDFEGASALGPNVAMFEDGVFAIMYVSLATTEFRLRWFDEFAAPLNSGVTVSPELSAPTIAWQGLAASGDLDTHVVYAVLNGFDNMSSNKDVFSVRRGPDTPASHWPIYQGPASVIYADVVLDGDIASFVWEQDGEVFLRRYNYALNIPTALPTRANSDFASRPGKHPTLAQRNGVTVVTWIACDAMAPSNCDIELRSFDFDWIEDAPVALALAPQAYAFPQLAIAEDDRVALVWSGGVANDRQVWAAQLDAGLDVAGAPWLLQDSIAAGSTPTADVAALADDSFVFAWPDHADDRVHIRRFIAPELPLVSNVGDEAPWPASTTPSWVRLSTAGNLVTVVWAGVVDNVFQIQGQVLSY